MEQGRTAKSAKNMLYGIIGMFFNLVISFVARTIFIKLLGDEFNGLNSLFSNILNVLSLAELGFAGAIAYALYKPLGEHDEKTVAIVMNFFAKVYRTIALAVVIIGGLCIPFLQYLINEPIETLPFSLGQLRIYFLLYLLNTAFSYLLAYKRTIITADQNSYLISNVDNIASVLMNVLQIIALIITKNYYVFLSVMLLKTIMNNLVINWIANIRYPYLKQYRKEKISKEISKPIVANVRAMMLHRVGGVVAGTITIIISAFVGVKEAGLYGNYAMIVLAVGMFVNVIFASLTASIGNLCVNEPIETQIQIFKRIDYLAYFIGTFCFISYVVLFNHFIDIWIGAERQFSIYIVIAIAFNSYISYLRKAVLTFRDAKGLFRADMYKPIVEAAIGISLAIGLSYVWGVFGVIAGYTLATIIVAVPVEVYVLFHKGFKKSVLKQIAKMLLFTLLAVALCALTYWIASYITIVGFLGFILKFLLCLFLPNIIFIACTFKTDEFKYFAGLFNRVIKKVFFKIFNKKKDQGELK